MRLSVQECFQPRGQSLTAAFDPVTWRVPRRALVQKASEQKALTLLEENCRKLVFVYPELPTLRTILFMY